MLTLVNEHSLKLGMKKLSEKINERMKALQEKYRDKKINQAWLSRTVGVSAAAVSKWLDGSTSELNGDTLVRAAKALECSPEWLSSSSISVRPVKVWDDDDPLEADEVEVPMLDLKLSAGTGRLQWEVNPSGYNRFRKAWCEKHRYDPMSLTTMLVDGESMSDVIPDGASVTINIKDKSIRNGKIYAIDFRGQFMIKRLFVMSGGGVKIVSENSDKNTYPDIDIPPEHCEDLNIMGRAVCYSTDL